MALKSFAKLTKALSVGCILQYEAKSFRSSSYFFFLQTRQINSKRSLELSLHIKHIIFTISQGLQIKALIPSLFSQAYLRLPSFRLPISALQQQFHGAFFLGTHSSVFRQYQNARRTNLQNFKNTFSCCVCSSGIDARTSLN